MTHAKSHDYQQRAKALIPGVSQLLSKRPDMFSDGVWPAYYQKAKGAQVWDLDGHEYIDMSIAGIGANVLGYADDDVNKAVHEVVELGSSSSLNCPEEVDLAQYLCELHPWASKVRFTRCGGEAMSVAVRIARAYTQKDIVIICGYHGWHDWYLAANLGTQNALGEHLLPGLSPRGVPAALAGTTLTFPYNDLEGLQAAIKKAGNNLAAIVMEPIRNIFPKPGFLSRVKELAQENQAVFIFDEISSGFRLCTGGAHLTFGVTPDIAVFSKALGNGYPIAAIIGRSDVMDAAQESFISSTMWTERIGPTAALATIKKFKVNNVATHLIATGTRIQQGWAKAAVDNHLAIHVGGIAPLSHFTFDDPDHAVMKAYFIQAMLLKGFLASTIYYAMFAHTSAHVNAYLEAVQSVFAEIHQLKKSGQLRQQLKGKPASSGFKRLT